MQFRYISEGGLKFSDLLQSWLVFLGEGLSHLLLSSSLMNPPLAHIVRPLQIQYLQTPQAFQGEKAQRQLWTQKNTTAPVFSRLLPFGFSTHQLHLNSVLKLGIEQLGLQDNILDEVYVEDA